MGNFSSEMRLQRELKRFPELSRKTHQLEPNLTKPVVSIHSETYKGGPNPIPGSVTQYPPDQFHGTENCGVALSVLGGRKVLGVGNPTKL